jgi:putative transport protein
MFKKTGLNSVIVAIVTALAGGIGVFLVFKFMNVPSDVATGLYCGGLTNTPALAAAMETAKNSAANISSGYGIAYPFGMVSVVLFNQFLPKIIKKNPIKEEEKWQKKMEVMYPLLVSSQYQVDNKNIIGKSIKEINPHREFQTNFSRILRGTDIYVASPDFVLQKGDIVKLVGPEKEKILLENLIGKPLIRWIDNSQSELVTDARVMENKVIGKRIRDLHFFAKYNIVITRVIRSGFQFSPSGGMTLEMGDVIRIIGEPKSLKKVKKIVQGNTKQLEFTDFVPYLLGLFLGVLVGKIPIPLPNGLTVNLGAAGGVFIVALVLGHLGRIGKWRFYVPNSVHNFSMELGLMIFLAGAGMMAGSRIVPIIQEYGLMLFVAGAFVTAFTILITFFIMWKILKMNIHDMMGSLSGGMTNPPALAAANSNSKTGLPTIAYAGVMPLALIFKILGAQLLILFLH